MRGPFLLLLLVPMLALAGCPSSDPPAPPAPQPCVDAAAFPTCTPPYEPTYDLVYANTFQPNCAKSGFSCHSPEGHQGGLDFFDKDAVYTQLKSHSLTPGSPECSVLAQRVIATDGKFRMPPGRSLPAGDQCAILEWIRAGAPR